MGDLHGSQPHSPRLRGAPRRHRHRHRSRSETGHRWIGAVQVTGKRIALALKQSYGCDGTSFRQHNEPRGDQEVWHDHLQVFPRYEGDELYRGGKRNTTPEERAPHAEKLRAVLSPRS